MRPSTSGPMLMGALQQMLNQVQWGELDVLIIDLPPGTGDVQLTLCQKTELTGAIVVSTPQDVALLDARKALDMFATLHTPILGMIENMSQYICPNCGRNWGKYIGSYSQSCPKWACAAWQTYPKPCAHPKAQHPAGSRPRLRRSILFSGKVSAEHRLCRAANR